jgi:hypothetical protein
MGTLQYGARVSLNVDDRTLAHLQSVIIAKLRRSETFAFSWRSPQASGEGRSTLWMHAGADLHFEYFGSRPPTINRAWLAQLTAAANSNAGLHLLPEPEPEPGESTASSRKQEPLAQ